MEVGGPLAAWARAKEHLSLSDGNRSQKRGPVEWGQSEVGHCASACLELVSCTVTQCVSLYHDGFGLSSWL